VTTLTLSLRRKATVFRIILWRCWARSEHGIAFGNSISLQPLSIEGSKGFNVAGGIAEMTLELPIGLK
jgi:hypothetical protein